MGMAVLRVHLFTQPTAFRRYSVGSPGYRYEQLCTHVHVLTYVNVHLYATLYVPVYICCTWFSVHVCVAGGTSP